MSGRVRGNGVGDLGRRVKPAYMFHSAGSAVIET
jgi:hypothetical protein